MIPQKLKNSNYTTICIMILATLENYSRGRGTCSPHLSAHLKVQGQILAEGFFHLPKILEKNKNYFEGWHIIGYPVTYFQTFLSFFLLQFFSSVLMVWNEKPWNSKSFGLHTREALLKITMPKYIFILASSFDHQFHFSMGSKIFWRSISNSTNELPQ